MTLPPLPVGTLVKFDEERRRYVVRASSARFAVCTKPLNLRPGCVYTIIDFAAGVRGPENLVFEPGADSDQDCENMLHRLTLGTTEVSRRRRMALNARFSYQWGLPT